jgi:nucleotide-binding universal stress UspA family protein
VDQTPASESALGFAFAEASLQHAPLVVAHLVRFEIGLLPVSDPVLDTALDAARDTVGDRIARWTEKYPDVETRVVATRAHAAAGLVELSRTARLVVVGSRGRGGFAGHLLGSVSQAVLHHADSPVAVVRADG